MSTSRMTLRVLVAFMYACFANSKEHPKTKSILSSNVIQEHSERYHSSNSLCPVTSLFNFKIDGYFRYPLDLFEPHLLKKILHKLSTYSVNDISYKILNSKLFNCTDNHDNLHVIKKIYHHITHPRHVCSDFFHTKCPVHKDAIDMALRRSSKWIYNSTLLDNQKPLFNKIWKAMSSSKNTIRVIIFGGSAPRGAQADGCFCDPTFDKKCAIFNNTAYRKVHPSIGKLGTDVLECGWPFHFVKWFKSISHAKVKPYYLMRGGTNMQHAANAIVDDFTKSQFTSNDIIFFDYSMNEAMTYAARERMHKQEIELERAIRAIYETSESKNSSNWPLVILTETYAYKIGYDWQEPSLSKKFVDYTDAYTKIASHYKIPIFSFRDVIWSSLYKAKHLQHVQKALTIPESHPLFFNHLFFADLFADIFLQELNRAYDYNINMTIYSKKEINLHVPDTVESIMALPPSIYKFDDTVFCDHNIPPLLDLRATDFVNNDERISSSKRDKKLVIGTFKSTPKDSWNIYTDSKTKYGWIDEFPTNYDIKVPRVLDFYFEDKKDSIFSQDHVITIQYLRTYKNAGKFNVKLCGFNADHYHIIHGNTLWDGQEDDQKDWRTNRISTIETATKSPFSNEDEIKHANDCLTLLRNKKIIKEKDTRSDIKVLEIIHIPVEKCLKENNSDEECQAITQKQKVKIVSVKVCRKKSEMIN